MLFRWRKQARFKALVECEERWTRKDGTVEVYKYTSEIGKLQWLRMYIGSWIRGKLARLKMARSR